MVRKKTTSKKSKGSHKNYPLPRRVIFAPWRHTYIKRTRKEVEDCAFCEALKIGKSLKSLIVHKGAHCTIILNKFPYNAGHTMIIPNRHTAEFENLSESEFSELHEFLKKAMIVLRKIYSPQGLNVGMNLGRAGGAGIVDHLHYHLVPRWSGDTNFMPLIAETKVISETLEETYKKLVPLFL